MNAASQKTLFSSAKRGGTDEWSTPQDLFEALDSIYHFNLDVCATALNAKCRLFYTEKDNGLAQPWKQRNWCNAPYSEIARWVAKGIAEAKLNGAHTVYLLPARTDTKWFASAWMQAMEIIFLQGRLKFGGHKNSAPFPSCLIYITPQGHGAPEVRLLRPFGRG
jgi:phage N-6-adenine-methyltransferase